MVDTTQRSLVNVYGRDESTRYEEKDYACDQNEHTRVHNDGELLPMDTE